MKFKISLLLFLLLGLSINAQNLAGIKICINPGHGGYDSDDRNVVIAPYTTGNQNGFWESQSNLDKGKQLRTMLEAAGATVIMTRTTNTTADDLPLSQIVAMANQSNADFMLSIHSNAGSGVANHVLMIHYGADLTDTNVYNNYNPNDAAQKLLSDKSRAISTEIAKNLYANQLNTWSSGYNVSGDKTFARVIMGWSDGYGVLRGLSVPGVISEGSMHDYIPETYRLMNMEYKWLEAWNFFKSFCTYYQGGSIPTGNIAGSVRDSRIKLESSYNKFAGRDQLLPLNGAKVTLIETGETYTVDQMQNGIYVFKNLAPGTYHVKAENTGYYSQTQEVTVTANNISYSQFGLNRVRNTPPQVVSYTPNVAITDSVEASTDIVLNFNWDMDEASTSAAFSITPSVSGKITYEDTNYRLRFTPDKPFNKSTVYTVKLAKSASHPDNLSMTEDFTFQFLTKNRNRLALLASNPYDGNSGVYYNSPSFRLIFDRKLNTSNVQTGIRVLDENGVTLAKTTRSVVNNSVVAPYGSTYFNLTTNLVAGKEYTLVVDGDIADEIGMKVVEPIQMKFKAKDVPVNNQTVVDAFETVGYTYSAPMSSDVTAAAVATSSTKLFGAYSNRFTASYSSQNGEALFGLNTPFVVSSDKFIGLHLFGDMTGSEVWLQLSAPGTSQLIKLCDLNFYGWEFKEVSLATLVPQGSWTLTAVKIKRKNAYNFSASTDILLDNMLVYDAAILSVNNTFANSLKIYPNPSSDVVCVDGLSDIDAQLSLYSVSGVLLRAVTGNKISVQDVETGTYILKINSGGNFATKAVFVVR